ncbi:MAG: serine hydrolase, partial [Ferruginibacter sp.]
MGKLVIAVAIFISCSTTKQSGHMHKNTGYKFSSVPADTAFLETLLKNNPVYFADILKSHKDWNVQIIYTQVNRGTNGIPDLVHHYYHVDAGKYFYPASTVKLPIVLLALQKLNELKDRGIDMNSTMLTETAFSGQTAVFNDPTTVDGRPSVAHYIKKILMVSDNDAFNRLYEFLGQEYIHAELKKKGYDNVQILHRLNIFLTEEENRSTNPVKFYNGSKLQYEQAAQKSELKYASRKDSIGKGYYKGGTFV